MFSNVQGLITKGKKLYILLITIKIDFLNITIDYVVDVCRDARFVKTSISNIRC